MANLRTNLPGSADDRRRDDVMDRVRYSQQRYGGQNEVFRRLNRYYLSMSPSTLSRESDRPVETGREPEEDVFVSLSYSVVESAVPNWLFSLFGYRPYIQVLGRTEDDHKRKDAVEMMLDYDFAHAQAFVESIPVARSVFKYGTGVAKVTYDYQAYYLNEDIYVPEPQGVDPLGQLMVGQRRERRKRLVVEYDGPRLEWVSVFNFGVDPLYWRLRDMRFVWERRWSDRETLRDEDARYYELTGKRLYKNLERIPPTKRRDIEEIYQTDAGDDTSELMGWTPTLGRRRPIAQIRDVKKEDDQAVEIIEYWERDAKVLIANGETIIHDGPNPYQDKKLPYVMTKCIDLEGYPWGMGQLHVIEGPQEETNSWRNLVLRSARYNVNKVWAVDPNTPLPPHAADISPGDILQVPFATGGRPLLSDLYEKSALPPEAYTIEDRIFRDAQRALAYSEGLMFGQQEEGDTATQARMAGQGTHNRFRLMNAQGEFTYLMEVAKLFYSRRQQFFKEEEVFRIIGKEGIHFKRLTPEEIAGEFDFEPTGQSFGPNQDVLRQQLIEAVALVKGDPVFLQITNVYELWKEVWRKFDQQFPDRFLSPPPEKQWDPQLENIILGHGEYVRVEATEPHEEHIQVHSELMRDGDIEVIENVQKHIREHEKFLNASAPKAQEQPGRQAQFAGERPGVKPGTPTQGQLEAIVGGGTSGG